MGKTQHLQKSENVDLAYIEACCDTYDKLGDERFCWILHRAIPNMSYTPVTKIFSSTMIQKYTQNL